MNTNIVLSGLQIAASIARLGAFALAVLIMGNAGGAHPLLLTIGYLPYLSFFDVLLQSSSRAAFLRGGPRSAHVERLRLPYAATALLLLAGLLAASSWSPPCRAALVVVAWPLGAIGYVWERLIARRDRQFLLSTIELALITAAIAAYALGALPWPILLLCIVGFPVARLIVVALPLRAARDAQVPMLVPVTGEMTAMVAPPVPVRAAWATGSYVGASLAQQLIAASAASLPAIYAQTTGDWRGLTVNVALFRSLHSLAAIASLTINSMSSRIFYRQGNVGIEALEARVLASPGLVLWALMASAAAAAVAAMTAIVFPIGGAIYSVAILPIMAAINVESSILYNRGRPIGTVQCQLLIFLLSVSFLCMLLGRPVVAMLALVVFAGCAILMVPVMLQTHRQLLATNATA